MILSKNPNSNNEEPVRHIIHRSKKEIIHKQQEKEWEEELKNYDQTSLQNLFQRKYIPK